jgi:hypothetical protein
VQGAASISRDDAMMSHDKEADFVVRVGELMNEPKTGRDKGRYGIVATKR